MEELVAEIASALILADLGISVDPRPDHAAYIASWLKVLKSDTSAVFTAASKAQAAIDWMHVQQPPGAARIGREHHLSDPALPRAILLVADPDTATRKPEEPVKEPRETFDEKRGEGGLVAEEANQ